MTISTGYGPAEQSYLYGGGIQTETDEHCYRCGEDLDAEAEQIDGEWYCGACIEAERDMFKHILQERFSMYDEPFEKHILKTCIEDFMEELE